ncbi:MAG: hypothetical protein AB1711_05945 [Thermodesulfobacteriota bacterium]
MTSNAPCGSTGFFTLSAIVVAAAGDFDWMRDLNTRAEADLSGFRARLAARFNIGDAQVKVVLSNVERPADAYMILRFGEMSARPIDYVMERYRAEKGKGWGVLAKSLGIKPGSREFHALKRGHDIDDYSGKGKNKGKDKGKCKNKSKGKGRD